MPISEVPLVNQAEWSGCGSLDSDMMGNFRKRAVEIIRKARDTQRCLDRMRIKAMDILGVGLEGGDKRALCLQEGNGANQGLGTSPDSLMGKLPFRTQFSALDNGSAAGAIARDRGEKGREVCSDQQQGPLHFQAGVQFMHRICYTIKGVVQVYVSLHKITMLAAFISSGSNSIGMPKRPRSGITFDPGGGKRLKLQDPLAGAVFEQSSQCDTRELGLNTETSLIVACVPVHGVSLGLKQKLVTKTNSRSADLADPAAQGRHTQ